MIGDRSTPSYLLRRSKSNVFSFSFSSFLSYLILFLLLFSVLSDVLYPPFPSSSTHRLKDLQAQNEAEQMAIVSLNQKIRDYRSSFEALKVCMRSNQSHMMNDDVSLLLGPLTSSILMGLCVCVIYVRTACERD